MKEMSSLAPKELFLKFVSFQVGRSYSVTRLETKFLRARIIEASDPKNTLAQTSFHSPKSSTHLPPLPAY